MPPSIAEKASLALGAYSGLHDLVRDFFVGRDAWSRVGNIDKAASLFFLGFSMEKSRLLLWCERTGFELRDGEDEGNDNTFLAIAGHQSRSNGYFANERARELIATSLTVVTSTLSQIRILLRDVGFRDPDPNYSVPRQTYGQPPENSSEMTAIEIIAEKHQERWRQLEENRQRAPASARIANVFGKCSRELEAHLGVLREQNSTLESHLVFEQNLMIHELIPSLELAGVSDRFYLGGIVDVTSNAWPHLSIAAANIYHALAGLQYGSRGHRVPTMLRQHDLEPSTFSRNPGSNRERSLVTVKERGHRIRCLVEWRFLKNDTMVEKARVCNVMEKLVQMLQLKNPDEYMVLQTRGFVEDESEIASASPRIWFGLIYQLPPSAHPNLPPISLEEMIRDRDAPALGQRFELARKLARSLLLFHTSRWLHESLHPKNVLFFRAEMQVHGSLPSLDHPFIGGFEYSRGPLDQSEKAENRAVRLNVYQHPQRRRQTAENAVRYRREFDIYSLGCLLCDIAKWQTIENTFGLTGPRDRWEVQDGIPLEEHEWGIALKEKLTELPADVGEVYTDVVRWCLGLRDGPMKGDIREPSSVPEGALDIRDKQLSYAYMENVYLQLEKCRA